LDENAVMSFRCNALDCINNDGEGACDTEDVELDQQGTCVEYEPNYARA
jgi:hypothetical protein